MDLINITFAGDASRRALLGARLDDPVVPDTPSLLTRARRALARTHRPRPPASRAAATRPRLAEHAILRACARSEGTEGMGHERERQAGFH